MSEWAKSIGTGSQQVPPGGVEPVDNQESGWMPIHTQVITGIAVGVVAFFFLLIIYAMLKNRRIIYCDVWRMQKEMKDALGYGGGGGGGRGGGGGGGKKEKENGEPLLGVVITAAGGDAGKAGVEDRKFAWHGPVTIV